MKPLNCILFSISLLFSVVILCVLSGCKPEELGAAHPTTADFYEHSTPTKEPRMWVIPKTQSDEEVKNKSTGCMTCHKGIENPSMHESTVVKIGCVDCHGGNAQSTIKATAHVQPRGHWYAQTSTTASELKINIGGTPEAHDAAKAPTAHEAQPHASEHGTSAANPKRTYQAWMMESPEFVRFINPGDLRVAKYTCGECHAAEVRNVPRSMMAHGAMLWGAALYNNGAHNQKAARFGESYTFDGEPARLQSIPRPTDDEIRNHGVLPFLDPLPRYNVTQPGNILRVFERGGKLKLETALQDKDNDPGRPETKLSIRGIGTSLSTDPVFLGLQKTRLLDPLLWQLGTNDSSGDYRSSGCSACHVVYANDRDKAHSGPYAQFGRNGQSFSSDEALKSIVGKETGHPISHKFSKAVPSSQCVVCHMHPGTTVTMTYYGNLWWDNETEGSKMYPKTQLPKKSEREEYKIKIRNPEGSALRGKWGDPAFLEGLYDKNDEFKQVQFADYNGHSWIFRNVYKQDKHGNLLDLNDKLVPFESPDKFKKGSKGEPIAGSAVHMQDIHQEKGMHCTDCHFQIDNHGNGKLYGEVRNATEITCVDCHGTVYKRATLKTTGNSAPEGGTDLSLTQTSFGKRFKWQGDTLVQQSSLDPNVKWEVKQTIDVISPGHPSYNEKARLAKTMRRDGKTWGDVPADSKELAHQNERMDCYTCHTSWVASCFGCHLPMKANQARTNNHFEGGKSRNWTQYNFQTLREDVFMLGIDGTVKENKIAPVRSTCAVIVGSQNAQRDWIYSQQQTISAEGFSGQAFSPHYPHAVRAKETKQCTDCHVSKNGDNNAQMAQLLMQGTNQTNFMLRYVYVASQEGGVNAVVVSEQDEPQAVLGSTLHRDAYPEEYAKHLKNDRELEVRSEHHGEALGVQLRGEYLYTARGKGGLTIYDVANIDNKDFSERITSAPVSPLGQRLYVKSKDCTSVISPTVLGVDPTRQPPFQPRNPLNQEQPINPIYAFLYCTDREEGLFTVMAATLLNGDPTDNFLRRHLTFNPGGILNGAVNGVVAGNYLYVCCDAGLVVVDISKIGTELVVAALKLNPDGTKALNFKDIEKIATKADPELLKVVSVIPLNQPKAVRIQFRYAFVVDADGMKVIDVTDPASARLIDGASVPFKDARNLYLSRTYAYVAAGCEGLAIVDIEKAESPRLDQTYTADGHLDDVQDVKLGMTNASIFAYLANGHHGLAVVQLTSPETVPAYLGWAAKPKPELIATKHMHGNSVSISEGLQRDRGVDESGNQLSVFNRVGSRPFNKTEMERLYKIDGKVFTVTNEPPGTPNEMKSAGGQVDPAVKARIEALEVDVKRERNPSKKKKLQEELDELKKKAEEQSSSGGGANAKKIQELEETVKRERNPAKKKKLQQELDDLKSGKGPAVEPPKVEEQPKAVEPEKPPDIVPVVPPTPAQSMEQEVQDKIDDLKDKLRRERNPIKMKVLEEALQQQQQKLDELKKSGK